MRYLSKVASLACIAGVSMTLVGCGGGSSTPPQVEDNTTTCPIPESVKAKNVVLDQNNTKEFLGASFMDSLGGALILQNVAQNSAGFMRIDTLSASNTLSGVNKQLDEKVVNIISNIKALDEDPLESSDIEVGDDIACLNGGTYSLHYNFTESDGEEDGAEVSDTHLDISVKFNNCQTTDDTQEAELASFVMYYNGFANRMFASAEDENDTIILNGESNSTLDLSFSMKDTYTENGDENETVENRTFDFIANFEAYLENNDISFSSSNSNERYSFLSNGKLTLSVKVDDKWSEESTEKDDDGDTNITVSSGKFVFNTDLNMNFKESSSSEDLDDNTTEGYVLQALCYAQQYALDGNGSYYEYVTDDENDENVTKIDNNGYITSIGNGYISVSIDEEDDEENGFFDAYQDNHKLVSNVVYHVLKDDDNDVEDINNSFSVNGTIGSTLLGGSVSFNTTANWLSSNEFKNDQTSADAEEVIVPYFWIDYTPYAGQTTMSSKNKATIGFDLKDDDTTYGYIQIDDQDPVEYDSVYDMFEFED